MIERLVKGLETSMRKGLRALNGPARVWRSVRRGCRFVLILLLLLSCLSCAALGLLVRRAIAGEPGSDVMLAIDNSNSMFDKNGVGSDSELRRIEAAQMFITYLGVDSGSSSHRLGVIFFGGEAKEVVPLTPLISDDERSKMASLIADPQRMEWTDPAAALTLSRDALLPSGQQGRERAVVLLTDGKPEWDHDPTPEERRAVIDELRRLGDQFAEDDIDLFVILLANEATDADPEIGTTYVPLWRSITETTGGRFYQVRRADDLFTIYHDILLTLSATESAGPVVDTTLEGALQEETVVIEPNLARVTYLVRLSSTDVAVTIHRPNGQRLQLDDPDVRHAGWGTTAIWAVTRPQSGEWQVRMGGRGSVTVWKDFLPLPQQERVADPSPTPLPPSPTPTVTPSPTPAPRLVVRDWPEAAFVGRPVQVSASLQPQSSARATYWAAWQLDGEEVSSERLLDDGREGDARAGDGRYGALVTPPTTGTLLLQAWSEVKGREIASWEGRLRVEPYPVLRLISPQVGETWQVDEPVSVAARWHAGEVEVGTDDPLTVTLCPADGTSCRIFTGTVGHPLKTYAPSDAGSYTLSVDALVNVPGASSVRGRATRTIVVQRPVPGWIWAAVTGAFAAIIGGWWVYRYQRGLPRLVGRLRVLTAPAEYTGPTLTDLSSLNRRSIRLGGRGAALELPPEGAPWANIRALADESGMELSPCNGRLIRVNGYELTGPHLLSDGDRIVVDGATLRYEHLHYGL
jgi:hypothetical protein